MENTEPKSNNNIYDIEQNNSMTRYRRVWIKGHYTHIINANGRRMKVWVAGHWRKVPY